MDLVILSKCTVYLLGSSFSKHLEHKWNHYCSFISSLNKPNLHTLKIMRELPIFTMKLTQSVEEVHLPFRWKAGSEQCPVSYIALFRTGQGCILMIWTSPFFTVENKTTLWKLVLEGSGKSHNFPNMTITQFLQSSLSCWKVTIFKANIKALICKFCCTMEGYHVWWYKAHLFIHFTAKQNLMCIHVCVLNCTQKLKKLLHLNLTMSCF